MPRFAVVWEGTIRKTMAVDVPADALHHIWSRYRDDMLPGTVVVDVDEGDGGVRLAQLTFRARVRREIEAGNIAEAVRTFTFDDRLPASFDAASLEVGPVDDPPPPEDDDR